MNPTRKITALADGDVLVEHGDEVLSYTHRGAVIYVKPATGPSRLVMVGDTHHPERLRDGESLEDAVRRLHAPAKAGSWNFGGWLGFVLLAVVVGAVTLAFGHGAYWCGRLWYLGDAPMLAVSALLCALGALFFGWLLSILTLLEGAPWASMLAVVALEGWAMAHWLNSPLF